MPDRRLLVPALVAGAALSYAVGVALALSAAEFGVVRPSPTGVSCVRCGSRQQHEVCAACRRSALDALDELRQAGMLTGPGHSTAGGTVPREAREHPV